MGTNRDRAEVTTMRVKFLHHSQAQQLQLQRLPHVASTGRVYELKRDQEALWVRAGKYIYNVTTQPDIYERAR